MKNIYIHPEIVSIALDREISIQLSSAITPLTEPDNWTLPQSTAPDPLSAEDELW